MAAGTKTPEEDDDHTPLIAEEGGVRRRNSGTKYKKILPRRRADWNPDLPYGGKVYLARKRKPEKWWVTTIEVLVVVGTLAFALYFYWYFDHVHFTVTRGYAHLGYSSAQHQVGQRLLHGKTRIGTQRDGHQAMEWFHKAARQGHPHASYNLAVGHLQGVRRDLLQKGDAHRLIAHAASKGVKEAHKTLNDVCTKGGCD